MSLRHPVLLMVLLLTACASVPPERNCVSFGGAGSVCLLPPASLPPADGAQLVSLQYKDDKQVFIGQLHIDKDVMRLAGTSLFGPDLFSVSYDGTRLEVQPANGPPRPEMLIAMLQLVVADQTVLTPALRGLSLRETVDGAQRVRELLDHGQLVVRVQIDGSPLSRATIHLDIPPAKLSVLMQPMDTATAP